MIRRSICLAAALLIGALLLSAPAAQAGLNEEVATVRAAVERFRDIRVAEREGWKPVTDHVNLMGEHWQRADNVPDYTRGERIDFTRPSNLLYAEMGGRMELISVAFVVRIGANDPLPDGFTGFQDLWHVHNVDQVLATQREVRPLLSALGRGWVDLVAAPDGLRRLAMVHVWLGPNPEGTFANHNPYLAYQRLGLDPNTYQGDMDAARGLALAHPEGCENQVGTELWLAAASRQTARYVRGICASVAGQIRERLNDAPAQRDAFAAAAWRAFDERRADAYSPAEHRRIAALVEGCSGLSLMQ